MHKKWSVLTYDSELVSAVEQQLTCSLHPLLLGRLSKVCPQNVHAFLHPSIQQIEQREKGMTPALQKGVARILQAIRTKEPVLIFGDYDGDGITSSAVAKFAFDLFGIPNKVVIPDRLFDGYGLKAKLIEDTVTSASMFTQKPLIITVDCGINSFDEVARLNALGYEVIITDHHCPSETIATNAYVIINPKCESDEYVLSNVAGVGVIWYFCYFIALQLDATNGTEYVDKIRRLLQFVAIGTVTDVMPLIGVNRAIVVYGLNLLKYTVNPGLSCLKEALELTQDITSTDISFKLGPRLNAAGRMGQAKKALDLITVPNRLIATQLASDLENLNTRRKDEENKVTEDIVERLNVTFNEETNFGLVEMGYNYHPGIVGIVAAKVANRYNRPTIVLNMNDDGIAYGSGRSIFNFNLLEALEACKDHLISYGGHTSAVGLKLNVEHFEAFKRAFNDYATSKLKSVDLTPIIEVDGELTYTELTEEFLKQQQLLAPFGNGNPEPVWLIRNVPVKTAFMIGGKHLKLILGEREIQGMLFNYTGKLPKKDIDLIGTIGTNTYRGNTSFQVLIQDFKESKTL